MLIELRKAASNPKNLDQLVPLFPRILAVLVNEDPDLAMVAAGLVADVAESGKEASIFSPSLRDFCLLFRAYFAFEEVSDHPPHTICGPGLHGAPCSHRGCLCRQGPRRAKREGPPKCINGGAQPLRS